MFNDKYDLTQAVLDGRKTMTRRIAYSKDILHWLDIGYDTKTHQCLICDGEKEVIGNIHDNLELLKQK